MIKTTFKNTENTENTKKYTNTIIYIYIYIVFKIQNKDY